MENEGRLNGEERLKGGRGSAGSPGADVCASVGLPRGWMRSRARAVAEAVIRARASHVLCSVQMCPGCSPRSPGILSVILPAFRRASSENIVSGLHVCVEV